MNFYSRYYSPITIHCFQVTRCTVPFEKKTKSMDSTQARNDDDVIR